MPDEQTYLHCLALVQAAGFESLSRSPEQVVEALGECPKDVDMIGPGKDKLRPGQPGSICPSGSEPILLAASSPSSKILPEESSPSSKITPEESSPSSKKSAGHMSARSFMLIALVGMVVLWLGGAVA